MDSDYALAAGIVLAILAIPALVSAFSDSRPPRAAALAFTLRGGCILFAVMTKPGGYEMREIPDVLLNVASRLLR